MKVRKVLEPIGITKICKKCTIEKDLSEFHISKVCKDGYESSCKDCKAHRAEEKGKIIPEGVTTKTCNICLQEKPFSAFSKHKGGKYGLQSKCKLCEHDNNIQYHLDNREVLNAKTREHYSENREREIARVSAYNKAHRIQINIGKRLWGELNKDKIKVCNRKQYLRNPTLYRIHARNYELKKKVAGQHTQKDVDLLVIRQNGKCVYCDHLLVNGYHVDHWRPLARGGSNNPDNLQLLCPTCNRKKWAHDPIEYEARIGFDREYYEKYILLSDVDKENNYEEKESRQAA